MVAFKNDPALKQKCLDLIKEFGFLKGINNYYIPSRPDEDRPPFYETELGLPEWLFLFEFPMEMHLPKALSKSWLFDYMSVIPVGADLSRVVFAFNHWMLTDPIYGEWQYFTEKSRAIGYEVISFYNRELYSPLEDRASSKEWYELWCQVANPVYWSDEHSKVFHTKHSFCGYVPQPTLSGASVWLGRSGEEGITDKFVLEVRVRLLHLLSKAMHI